MKNIKEIYSNMSDITLKSLKTGKRYYSLVDFCKISQICPAKDLIKASLAIRKRLDDISYPIDTAFRKIEKDTNVIDMEVSLSGLAYTLACFAQSCGDEKVNGDCLEMAKYFLSFHLDYPEKRLLVRENHKEISRHFNGACYRFAKSLGMEAPIVMGRIRNAILNGYYGVDQTSDIVKSKGLNVLNKKNIIYQDYISTIELNALLNVTHKITTYIDETQRISLDMVSNYALKLAYEEKMKFIQNMKYEPIKEPASALTPIQALKKMHKFREELALSEINALTIAYSKEAKEMSKPVEQKPKDDVNIPTGVQTSLF